MKNTGALLKAKRESSNLSLSEVALATKINPKILAAIENGDDSALPAKTILRGFLKSYALFLKMDVDEVLRTFQEETGAPPPRPVAAAPEAPASAAPSRSEAPTSKRRVSDDSSTAMRTAAVVVIVILIGLIIGVRELVEKYQREKVVDQAAVELKATPVTEQQTAATEAKPAETEPAAATTVDGTPVKPDEKQPEDAKAAEAAKLAEDKKAADAKAEADKKAADAKAAELAKAEADKKAADAKAAELAKAEADKKAAEAAKKPDEKKPENTALKTAKHEIILEALDKVEVKFQVKGETKRVSLGPTQVHTIHSDQPITIDLSDGGAVNVILDGRERGVPGDLGKPKTIKIP
jgi:cytoskeleton protein RodZ